MRYYVLFALVILAAFSAGALFTSRGVASVFRFVGPSVERLSAARRARWLLGLRLAPTVCGATLSVVFGVTFLLYEPRDTREEAGAILVSLAALTVALAALALTRSARLIAADSSLWRLMRQCRQWTARDGAPASVLETAYPVAAVAGVFQSRLMLSARVLRECTPSEIDAIVAHERAHMRRRDNLVRALLGSLPDRWLAPRVNAAIERAWTRAAEEAADSDAAGRAGAPRAALAATLIRVARMAEDAPPAWMPQLAFYQGTDLEHRVRTLLAEPRRDTALAALTEWGIAAVAVALVGVACASTSTLHALMEWSVQLLP